MAIQKRKGRNMQTATVERQTQPRIVLQLSPGLQAEIETMKQAADVKTTSELIRRALRFYQKGLSAKEHGEHLFRSPSRYVTGQDGAPVQELDLD
jgi:hypothetical protein